MVGDHEGGFLLLFSQLLLASTYLNLAPSNFSSSAIFPSSDALNTSTSEAIHLQRTEVRSVYLYFPFARGYVHDN